MVIVSGMQGGSALTPDAAPALARFVVRLEQDRRVRGVLGPVQSMAPQSSGAMGETVWGALARSAFISEDGSRLPFRSFRPILRTSPACGTSQRVSRQQLLSACASHRIAAC
jgi:hypothetical protein